MLVVERRQEESVVFLLPNGEQIEVLIVGALKRVRLGCSAPKGVRILRKDARHGVPVVVPVSQHV